MELAPFLSDELLEEARRVGRGRYAVAKRLGRSQPYGDPGEKQRVYIDAYSALAEGLVAAWLELSWVYGLLEDLPLKPPDVGSRIEVRWTRHEPGHLIVHHDDPQERLFVLVRGEIGDINVAGWTTGAYAQRQEFKANPRARNPEDSWVPARYLLLPELLAQMQNLA